MQKETLILKVRQEQRRLETDIRIIEHLLSLTKLKYKENDKFLDTLKVIK